MSTELTNERIMIYAMPLVVLNVQLLIEIKDVQKVGRWSWQTQEARLTQ